MTDIRITMQNYLFDHGRQNHPVDFELNPEKSGIVLKSFEYQGQKFEVTGRLAYVPHRWGHHNPGAGQVGKYILKDSTGQQREVLIQDYRDHSGTWNIALISDIKPVGSLDDL